MDFQRQPGFQDTARWKVNRALWGAQSTIQLATYSINDTGYRIHRDTETQRHRHTETEIQDTGSSRCFAAWWPL